MFCVGCLSQSSSPHRNSVRRLYPNLVAVILSTALHLQFHTNYQYISPCFFFSFLFCLCKYHPSCPTTRAWLPTEILTNQCRTQNRPSSPLFHWHCSGKLSLGYSRVKTGASPSQAKVLTGGGDLREAQVDVPLSVSHSCVWSQSWAQ